MALIKCKLCGGELNIAAGESTARCEYCGSVQTIPNADNEKKLSLFQRAGALLRKSQFDRASGIYESIVLEFPQEAEGYWGLVLCQYGIEYVDDPATGKKIPTCRRSSYTPVTKDENYLKAVEKADSAAAEIYCQEAQTLENLRQKVNAVSSKEEPYDIFICFKHTAESGGRTKESVAAERFYDMLVAKGYRVFFAPVTLEDKLGVSYEPYIFAALNSARLMLAFGSSYENYQATWVRNEWSRYLHLMQTDRSRTLIPCYLDMDADELPDELQDLNGVNFGRYGEDVTLLRNITDALKPKSQPRHAAQTAPQVQQVVQINQRRFQEKLDEGYQCLENEEWEKAKSCFDDCLDMDAENARCHLGLYLARQNYSSLEDGKKRNAKIIQTMSRSTYRVINLNEGDKEALFGPYVLPGYLERKEVEALHSFDSSYDSCENDCAWYLKEFQRNLKVVNALPRAVKYGDDQLREEIKQYIEDVEDAYQDAMAREKILKEQKIAAIQSNYQVFLKQFHANALDRYRQAKKRQTFDQQAPKYREEYLKNTLLTLDRDIRTNAMSKQQRVEKEEKHQLLKAHEKEDTNGLNELNEDIKALKYARGECINLLSRSLVLGGLLAALVFLLLKLRFLGEENKAYFVLFLLVPIVFLLSVRKPIQVLKETNSTIREVVRHRDGLIHYPNYIKELQEQADQKLWNSL